MAQYEILRSFPGPDGMFARGQVVDGDGFRQRNLESLVSRRYMAPVEAVAGIEESHPLPSETLEESQAEAACAPSMGVPVSTGATKQQFVRGRGRPTGSKNKPKTPSGAVVEA